MYLYHQHFIDVHLKKFRYDYPHILFCWDASTFEPAVERQLKMNRRYALLHDKEEANYYSWLFYILDSERGTNFNYLQDHSDTENIALIIFYQVRTTIKNLNSLEWMMIERN